MSGRIQFWSNRGRWPSEVPGFVFAARAVLKVGPAIHGKDWVGTEPVSPDPYGLPKLTLPDGRIIRLSQSSAKPGQKQSINTLLLKYRPDLGRKPAEYGAYGPKPLIFTDEEWDAGLDLAAQADGELIAQRWRFNETVALMSRACGEGKLVSALRPKQGGKMSDPLPVYLWHTEPERAAIRFDWGQMNPAKPFDYALGGDAFHYLYFGEESLDALLRSLPAPGADKTGAPETQRRQTSQGAAIDRALAEIPQWGGNVPRGLAPKKRDAQIQEFAKAYGLSIPDQRTIRRHLKEKGQ
ncbi:hypothetical protein [Mesorhizobium sp. M0778]|uniref:hypothetical protein n=1 Tax=Mesorhizobium sp. M0778 TaxID=2956999 RepID=UPI0033380C8E